MKYEPIVNNKPVSFRYWAIMIMRRHIMGLLNSSKCHKRTMIHAALHLNLDTENDEGKKNDALEDILINENQLSPIEELISNEDNLLINNKSYNFIVDSIKKYTRNKLTAEKYIIFLNYYMEEERNYNNIAYRMSTRFKGKYDYKAVDNLLQEIKLKIKKNKANYSIF